MSDSTTGPYADALIDRKHALTEQLRRIDEAVDTAAGVRETEPGDLELDQAAHEVRIDGAWYRMGDAEMLTRAGLHEIDQGLDDLGLFAHDQEDTS